MTAAAFDVGEDHHPEHIRAVLEGCPRAPGNRSGLGLETAVGAAVEVFQRSREHRAVMAAARRAGRPFSWASEQWADPDDVAAEIAWDAYQSWLKNRQCPGCGVDPDDILDPETNRLLDHGAVKCEKRGCEVCATIGRQSRKITTEERDMLGTYWTTAHRMPGEPFVDDGGSEFDAGGMAKKADLDAGGFA